MKYIFRIIITLLCCHCTIAYSQTDQLPVNAISTQQQGYLVNPTDTTNRQTWLYYGNKKADRLVRYPELLRTYIVNQSYAKRYTDSLYNTSAKLNNDNVFIGNQIIKGLLQSSNGFYAQATPSTFINLSYANLKFKATNSSFFDGSDNELMHLGNGSDAPDSYARQLQLNYFPYLPNQPYRKRDIDSLFYVRTGSGPMQTRSNGQADSLLRAKLDTSGRQLAFAQFGVKADAKMVTNATVTAGSNVILVPANGPTSADIGKVICIPYAGADRGLAPFIGQSLVGVIMAVNGAQVTISVNAIKGISGPRTVSDAGATAGGFLINSATANFSPADRGKMISMAGIGDVNNSLTMQDSTKTTWIDTVYSATQARITWRSRYTVINGALSVCGATVIWGTDNTAAIQKAVNAGMAQHKEVLTGNGAFLITSPIQIGSYAMIKGYGRGNSIFYPAGTGSGSGFSVFSADHHQSDTVNYHMSFRDFEINGMGVTTNSYTSYNKGFYLRPAVDLTIAGIYVHNMSATGIGCDFLKDYTIANNISIHNGRQASEFGINSSGGAGIGIGSGKWTTEPGLVQGNFTEQNNRAGILIEGQNLVTKSTGTKVVGNFSYGERQSGIVDANTDAVIYQQNTAINSPYGFRSAYTSFLQPGAGSYSRNTVIKDNHFVDCANPLYIISKEWGITVDGNQAYPGSAGLAGTSGFYFASADSGLTARHLIVTNNTVHDMNGNGILYDYPIFGTKFGNVIEQGNKLYNNGTAAGSNSAGTRMAAPANSYSNYDNEAYDTRAAGSKRQGYALTVTFSAAFGNYSYDHAVRSHDLGLGLENTGTMPAPLNRTDGVTNYRDNTWLTSQTFNAGFSLAAAQASKWYNTTNTAAEYGSIGWSNNAYIISTQQGSSGAARALNFVSSLNTLFNNVNSNSFMWQFAGNTGMSLTTSGLSIKHLIGNSPTPVITAGSGAGTSASISISGTDLSGTITLTTGANPAAGAVIATLTFNGAYTAAPRKSGNPAAGNAVTASLAGAQSPYYSTTSNTLVLNANTTALAPNTTYVWDYTLTQ